MIKAVITAAGLGTRMLPMTKETPKEMLPIFMKNKNNFVILPMLQLIYEQLYDFRIRDYCFVVGREKRSIENHFTPDLNFQNYLSLKNNSIINNFYKKLEKSNIGWVNQSKPNGFGDAVKQSEKFIGEDSFIVHGGDVAILSDKGKSSSITNLIKIGKSSNASAVLLFRKVTDPKRHGVPTLKRISKGQYEVQKVIEKPLNPRSNFGLLPIYYFKSNIFKKLKQIKPGKGNEFQLTDAIQKLIIDNEKVLALPIQPNESVIDVGTISSYKNALKTTFS